MENAIPYIEEKRGKNLSQYVLYVQPSLASLVNFLAILGSVILTKVRGEIKTRSLDHLKKCQTGLEVHFKEAEGCYGNKKARVTRRTKRACNGWCIWCSSTKVLIDT